MDKKWILIIIIIIASVGCGYLILDNSITVGHAVAVVDTSVITIPEGFESETAPGYDLELENEKANQTIDIKKLGKNNSVKLQIEKFGNKTSGFEKYLGNNTTKTPSDIEIFTGYYTNSSQNFSTSFFYAQNHTYVVNTTGYNNITKLNGDLECIVDTLRPDYKQSQDE